MINHRIHHKTESLISFSDRILQRMEDLLHRYPDGKQKSALLPLLHIAQEEFGGHLSVNVMDYIASLLNLKPIEVYEVATFYSMFNLDPAGKYVIEICRTGPCAFCGGEELLEYLKKKLNIDIGETTADGLFTLRTVECLGACGSAPVMQVNSEFYEFLSPEKIDSILLQLVENARENVQTGSTWVEKFF